MKPAPIPENENERIKSLRDLNILDTPPEERFDRLTKFAAQIFDVPIALVSLVDSNRQWFKSRQGLDATETPRDISFCGHAIMEDKPLVVENALFDDRFADNPLVAGDPNIRFYAGQPLRANDGNRVGTLCIIDRKPHSLSDGDKQKLELLGHLVENELNMVELIELNNQIQAARDAAETANRAKSAFLANMSHEFRTPMNAILGFTEILEGSIQDTTEREYLNYLKMSARTLLTLINDILDLSKVEAGKLELTYTYTSLSATLEEIEKIFEPKMIEKGLEFKKDIAQDLPDEFFLDEIRLRQILLNLIKNAIKFTDKGCITVSMRHTESGMEIRTTDLLIEVSDTGKGIPQNQQRRIFEAFSQVKDQDSTKYGGTGLGLAISASLANLMGGNISVESEVDKGSTFSVLLPNVKIRKWVSHEVQPMEHGIETFVFKPATIIIVDDVRLERFLINRFLADFDLTIIDAEHGQQALEFASLYEPDLMILDIRMPVLNGFQTAEIIKKDPKLKQIPIVALTASGMRETESEIRLIFDDFLRKPIGKSELINTLSKFLEHTKKVQLRSVPPKKEVLAPSDVQDVDVLLCELESQKAVVVAFVEVPLVDEIEVFAEQMQRLAEAHGYQALQTWADDVMIHARLLNVEKLLLCLKNFDALIHELRTKK